MSSSQPAEVRGALLVGSVPLSSSAEVFETVATQLGTHLQRIPDGETGARTNWTAWQLDVFAAAEGLESEMVDMGYLKRPKFRLKPGVKAEDITFGPLGYAKAAIASYKDFYALKHAGKIGKDVRFQVALPTPIAPVVIFVFPQDQAALEPRYEQAMLAELDAITHAIPADQLAIQWDTAIEFAMLEGVLPHALKDPEMEILERLARLGSAVPANAELGFHLCYGDSGGKHFKEPADTGKLVAVANGLARRLSRPLDWLHLPVPKSRDDDAYYAPLRHLALKPETELYLGLVHDDDTDGTRRRIAAASKFVTRFGVGTECGFGRRKREAVIPLLREHAAVAAALTN
jgi:hypothetical protein